VGAELTVIPAGDEVCPRLNRLAGDGHSAVRRFPIFINFSHLYGPEGSRAAWLSVAPLGQDLFFQRVVPAPDGVSQLAARQVPFHPSPLLRPARSAQWTLVPEIYKAWGFEEGAARKPPT